MTDFSIKINNYKYNAVELQPKKQQEGVSIPVFGDTTISEDKKNDDFTKKDIISGLSTEKKKILEKRNLLSLKNADGRAFYGLDIFELLKISDENWKNVEKNKLLTLKNADGRAFWADEIRGLSEISDGNWERVQQRKLLTLKNADGRAFSGYDINELSQISDKNWKNVEKNKLLTLKNAEGRVFWASEIRGLSEISDENWKNVEKRKLLTLKNADGEVFEISDINELSKISDEDWKNVEKRNLLTLKNTEGRTFDGYEINGLSKISDENWKNVEKRNLLNLKSSNGIPVSFKNCIFISQLAKISNKDWENNSKAKQAILNEIETLTIKSDFSHSTLYDLKNEKYEKMNEILYGKKELFVESMLEKFNKKYPDIELLINNDVSREKARKIIEVCEEYIQNQQKAKAPFAKRIMFCNMQNADGFYSRKDTIFINIDDSSDVWRSTLVHENGHYRDYNDWGYSHKKIPDKIQNTIEKILRDYALSNNQELIASLTGAIETPENLDPNNLTKILHVSKDEKGNYYLMLPKDCEVSKEELEELGEFLRDINCPEIIPDFDEKTHGKMEDYNRTLIRVSEYTKLRKFFSPNMLKAL